MRRCRAEEKATWPQWFGFVPSGGKGQLGKGWGSFPPQQLISLWSSPTASSSGQTKSFSLAKASREKTYFGGTPAET